MTPLLDVTTPAREILFRCEQFSCWRTQSEVPFRVGAPGVARALVCIEGAGRVEHRGAHYPVARGDASLLPAVVGACEFQPSGSVTLLEIALPEPGATESPTDGEQR
jgi:mannose-6-phosphate isomerase class I